MFTQSKKYKTMKTNTTIEHAVSPCLKNSLHVFMFVVVNACSLSTAIQCYGK